MTTWVPPQPGWICAECGFEYDVYGPAEIVDGFAKLGRRYSTPLTRGLPGEDLDALVRTRPAPETWSALEYSCHARDVFALTDARIETILAVALPELERFDPEQAAIDRDYASQAREQVAGQIADIMLALAERLTPLDADDWARSGVREGSELTVHWLAVNALHEGAHHLLDIGRALRQARGR